MGRNYLMLSYKIEPIDELWFVRVEVRGEFDRESGTKIITEARTLASDKNFNIFYDLRGAVSKVQLSDWFLVPRTLEVFQHKNARLTSVAVLLSRNDKTIDQYNFFETVTGNLGFRLKLFFEENDALDWLAAGILNNRKP